MRELRDTLNKGNADKMREANNRNEVVNAHQRNLEKTMVGVLPGDLT